MKKIGNEIRERREEKGLSLEEVGEKTKIKISYLEAIEEGSWGKLPGEVYLRGFLRTYSTLLGLDGQRIISEYEKERALEEQKMDEEEDVEETINKSFLVPILILLVIIAAGILAGVYLF